MAFFVVLPSPEASPSFAILLSPAPDNPHRLPKKILLMPHLPRPASLYTRRQIRRIKNQLRPCPLQLSPLRSLPPRRRSPFRIRPLQLPRTPRLHHRIPYPGPLPGCEARGRGGSRRRGRQAGAWDGGKAFSRTVGERLVVADAEGLRVWGLLAVGRGS